MLALLGFPVFGGLGFVAKWYMIAAALRAAYLGAPTPQTNLAIADCDHERDLRGLLPAGRHDHVHASRAGRADDTLPPAVSAR